MVYGIRLLKTVIPLPFFLLLLLIKFLFFSIFLSLSNILPIRYIPSSGNISNHHSLRDKFGKLYIFFISNVLILSANPTLSRFIIHPRVFISFAKTRRCEIYFILLEYMLNSIHHPFLFFLFLVYLCTTRALDINLFGIFQARFIAIVHRDVF